jgi:hypothetical protein
MLHETTTPSGLVIAFEDGEPDPETGKGKRRCYTVNGDKLPSVTTVLGVIDKPGLQWAAEKLTVAGCVALARRGELPQHPDAALGKLGHEGLRFRQVWDQKAQSGSLAHEDLVALAAGDATLRDLADLSDVERGHARGVSAWYADYRPEVVDQELMVASVEHGFAGRLDMRATTFKLPGLGLWDLKTTDELPRFKNGRVKPPYDEHLWQVEAYEVAARESGYGESDYRAVLRVDANGEYDVTVSWVSAAGFLSALQLYLHKRATTSTRPERFNARAAA